jgi:hypothetical protein
LKEIFEMKLFNSKKNLKDTEEEIKEIKEKSEEIVEYYKNIRSEKNDYNMNNLINLFLKKHSFYKEIADNISRLKKTQLGNILIKVRKFICRKFIISRN